MVRTQSFTIRTPGRGFTDITHDVARAVTAAGLENGLATVFIHHTSASLIIGENADPAVLRDLEAFFARLVPDGDPLYEHDAEGPDDMPAHVRSVLTSMSISMPIARGRPDLGTWQAVYLWEHRRRGYERRVSVTVVG
jgi:secondary thiamine-phosphate synthase enzyme